jgi:hypothetical protein
MDLNLYKTCYDLMAALRQLGDTVEKISVRKTSAVYPHSTRAIVVIDGVQATGMRPGTNITAMLSNYGTVLSIDFPHGRGFSHTRLVTQIQSEIKSYEHVTFIGVSLGGLIAYDTIVQAKIFGSKSTFDLVLIDTPTGLVDVSNQRARLARYVPAFPTPAWLNRIIFKKECPQTEDFDELSRKEWEEHIRRSHSYPFGDWIRQIRYLAQHARPVKGFLRGARVVFVKSAVDEIIQPDAYRHWRDVIGDSLPLIPVVGNKAHADLLEWPSCWRKAIETAIKELDS